MEIKPRAFPYPVLGPQSDDFTDGSIRLVNAAADAAPQRYSIRFDFEVTHADMLTMIASGDADAAVVIECRQNLFRRRHAVHIGHNEIHIPSDELRGEVHITPVISAARNLQNYRPSSLSPDYNGMTILVPQHGLMAYGPNIEFIAEPQADRLRKISSIMRVVESATAGGGIKVNIDGPRIHVEVSSELLRLYQSVAASREGSHILASMLVLPVLVDVFHRIKIGQEGLEDHRWFQVIRMRLQEIKQPVDALDFDPLKAAQSLLDSPFNRGIGELVQRLGLDSTF